MGYSLCVAGAGQIISVKKKGVRDYIKTSSGLNSSTEVITDDEKIGTNSKVYKLLTKSPLPITTMTLTHQIDIRITTRVDGYKKETKYGQGSTTVSLKTPGRDKKVVAENSKNCIQDTIDNVCKIVSTTRYRKMEHYPKHVFRKRIGDSLSIAMIASKCTDDALPDTKAQWRVFVKRMAMVADMSGIFSYIS